MTLSERYRGAAEYSFGDFSVWYWNSNGKFTFEVTRGEEDKIVHGETVLGDISRPSVQDKFRKILKSLFDLKGREGGKEAERIAREIIAEYNQIFKTKNKSTGESEDVDDWIEAKAEELLDDPYILREIKEYLDKKIVGEDQNKLLLFLIFLTKNTDPQACFLLAQSSTGKSYLVNNIKCLFEEDVLYYTRVTEKALDRIGKDITGKILWIGEGVGAKEAVEILRQWISEGKLRLLTNVKTEDGRLETQEIETVGKPVFITTQVEKKIDPELKTRVWTITLDESKEQTERILEFEARDFMFPGSSNNSDEELRVIRYALKSLKPYRVLVPYMGVLKETIPKQDVRIRRDFRKIGALIQACALLHQRNRPIIEIEGEEYLVATFADYRIVRSAILNSIKPTITGLDEEFETLLKAVKESGEGTVKEVTKKANELGLRLGQDNVYRKLNLLVDWGYLYVDKEGRRNIYELSPKSENNGNEFGLIRFQSLAERFGEKEFKEWLNSIYSVSVGYVENNNFSNPRLAYEDLKKYIYTPVTENENIELGGKPSSDSGDGSGETWNRVKPNRKDVKDENKPDLSLLDEEALERHRSIKIFIESECRKQKIDYLTTQDLLDWAVEKGVDSEQLDRDLQYLKTQGELYNPRGPDTWRAV